MCAVLGNTSQGDGIVNVSFVSSDSCVSIAFITVYISLDGFNLSLKQLESSFNRLVVSNCATCESSKVSTIFCYTTKSGRVINVYFVSINFVIECGECISIVIDCSCQLIKSIKSTRCAID